MAKRIVILGGGPIGIEAAVLAAQKGFDVTVFERGATGAHVARWGHVRFFSPWSLNRSPWGEAALGAAGAALAGPDGFPTAHEYLRDYLRPLVEATGIGPSIHNLTTVVGVARRDAFKGELIGKRGDGGPFIVAVHGPDGAATHEADIVLDATGVYGQPGFLGRGGLPAAGEEAASDRIERWIPDPGDRDHETYAGRHTLLVGDGYSAATTLRALVELRESAVDTRVTWLIGAPGAPYVAMTDDPLPQRLALAEFGNSAAAGDVAGVSPRRTPIARLELSDEQIWVQFGDGESILVDRVVSNVGYRPDLAITRELQVHHCYASEGPMKLAASLLAQSGNGDCLAQESAGVDTLRTPEADFWVVGGKSYGRNSNFVLRVGFEQIETILGEY